MEMLKTGVVSILVSVNVDFRAKKFSEQRGTLHNDKKVNPPRSHNPKCVCTKQQGCKICGVKTCRNERR